MHLSALKAKAREMMNLHGLQDWAFAWDRSLSRFGACHWSKRLITMSRNLTRLNDEARCLNTVLHEIAHAIAGREHGHDIYWQQKAVSIGCNGQRCYSNQNTITPPKKYQAVCTKCHRPCGKYHRQRNLFHRACGGKIAYQAI